jgi:hypothetical protein
MKKLTAVSFLVMMAGALSSTCSATSEYVIANANNATFNDNTLVVYTLDTTTGTLSQVGVLETGGQGLGALGDAANVQQAVAPNGACIFALNAGSSDIASFSEASGYARIGNYSNSALDATYNGGSLALAPNGKYLYASYSATQNIAAWAVNPDCSLTFLAAYIPSGGGRVGAIKVTPNGVGLVASLRTTYGGAELFAVDQATGALTDVNFASFFDNPYCTSEGGCYPDGLDFAKDSKYVVFASGVSSGVQHGTQIAITCQVASLGLISPRGWSLYSQAGLGLGGNQTPFFGAAGYAGSGSLYFGTQHGVMAASFVERPLKIKLTNTTLVAPTFADGSIAVTGSMMVIAEYPNQIGVFSINADGSLTELSTTALKGDGVLMFSLSVFPSTR